MLRGYSAIELKFLRWLADDEVLLAILIVLHELLLLIGT